MAGKASSERNVTRQKKNKMNKINNIANESEERHTTDLTSTMR